MKRYTLTKMVPKTRYFEVYLDADANDGDYISTKTEYTEEEFESIIDDLINLRDNYSGSHRLSSYSDDTELDIPTSEWGGYCHTLVQLVIRMYDTDGCVYEVNI